ncbi:alpha-amylase [Pedobacter sp. KR3-3]|uniref:Alpha-amylase n=1 Tax=Pedobacter albus TaxID=3113905 RepID=A0ABU7I2I0_9SPHI|nr:alpha-amylase [Pedobacter sp. KR3-3]MEE1943581.1 alpha-amylase [Pedobacter sp. KR3-3]
MQNPTLIQYFHWYYNEADNLWTKVKKEAENLATMGITGLWLPPAYKGTNGTFSIGYDTYDLFDLGEFDQKNSTATKYGTKQEYQQAIEALHQHGLQAIADTIFNHKAGGDELEKVSVRRVNKENRNEFTSDVFEIEAWTRFTFPGRKGQYSEFIWDHRCFSGVDWAEDLKESAIFMIENGYGEGWEKVPSNELGNYDYLMFDDIDFRNPAVREELKYWGKWYYENTKVDGFRLDAVKHISPDFLIEWMDEMEQECVRNFYFVAENWDIQDVSDLDQYLEITGGRTQLFDSLLHHNLYLASTEGKDYDMSRIFENTLVGNRPELAVTFVDNHDSQPMQALESFVDYWFRPLAYALILLRVQGTPCVFFTDVYGASYEDKAQHIDLATVAELPVLLKIRRDLAYGEQQDYLNHANCIGWTRTGDAEHENSGLAVLMCNGDEGFKEMQVGKAFAGRVFVDALDKRQEEITIDDNGNATFLCNAGSVSVWVPKEAMA